ncbi:hypothetical protein COCC4DRAFT_77040 [Bipolaris maydis ATCC 48331]|uniref:Uncharacterized protein n=2 Tax=Cochliobolus heterostrophus TaxID=5016 RepID=M2TEC3_COCH5|nr:uncharacterized protein COCC4DRAFT_77040 [Bipolaris maydis ATCC 48331]EMD84701.1 hypothetical protein COCHEDRAFT_1229382 [Bipolaris maydis C5]KAH7548627.1 hypothetical protein BM1_10999 [Bipolaris maydis]EMD84864.1 hypothetical protein COCHEDRAFT_1229305 [Bipolaris maydis C5]ENH98648.1 hypothetical protein COCC4DRAFT_77040 [Bipolaris maydis ATCC 48331]KAJ5021996.1 hypothetical protein J3E73DRAFT_385690 [Bipolaris maydis]
MDRTPLPKPGAGFKFPWTIFVLSTVLLLSIGAFHLRWDRTISSSPIHLPQTFYTFTKHRDLIAFDENTQKSWNSIIGSEWWDMSWTDSSGQVVVRGLDMFHKLHCLIALREEFTKLSLDSDRHLFFQGQKPESMAAELHLGHCFDFLRQGILCAADSTLEPLGPGYTETDGTGVSHQCYDWTVLMSHAGLKNQFTQTQ